MGGTNQVVSQLPKVGDDCMCEYARSIGSRVTGGLTVVSLLLSVIGVDVTHPAPGARDLPSIIASVATTDGKRNRFNSELGTQLNTDSNRKAQEAILDGHAIYNRHLTAWMSKNSNRLPSSIVVFRDGVSEGEYQHVVNLEVDTLKQVCGKVSRKESHGESMAVLTSTFILLAQAWLQSQGDVHRLWQASPRSLLCRQSW
jgi:hypothetical protein